jgi:predicted DNA-binding antitoxin AbrB/MazE fold protein
MVEYPQRQGIAFQGIVMPITVEAVYENGVLKPSRPLPLKEQEKVQVTVHTAASWVEATAGMMGWTGDAETLERIALDPEFLPEEAP